jgi:hypothetical protein
MIELSKQHTEPNTGKIELMNSNGATASKVNQDADNKLVTISEQGEPNGLQSEHVTNSQLTVQDKVREPFVSILLLN